MEVFQNYIYMIQLMILSGCLFLNWPPGEKSPYAQALHILPSSNPTHLPRLMRPQRSRKKRGKIKLKVKIPSMSEVDLNQDDQNSTQQVKRASFGTLLEISRRPMISLRQSLKAIDVFFHKNSRQDFVFNCPVNNLGSR